MKTTKIEWTDKTWNPVTGCTKISQGCAHCYAEVMSRRLKAMGLEKYTNASRLAAASHHLCLLHERPLSCGRSFLFCGQGDGHHPPHAAT